MRDNLILHPANPAKAGFAPDRLERVDALMRSGLKDVFPAAVLLIARRGGVLFHRAYGWSDPETRQRPVQLDSLFDLASVTKLFTATAFMILVEAGRVELNTPVAHVLPDFGGVRPIGPIQDPRTGTMSPPDPAFAGQMVDADAVTFWHLLTHTSGLAAWQSLFQEHRPAGKVPLPHQVTAESRVRRLTTFWARCGFAYPPGQRLVYSDLGFILLGEAVSRLAEMPLNAYLRRSVLDPLALTNTTYNPLAEGFDADSIVPTEFCSWRQRRCRGEVHDENAAFLGGVAGHAGLFATAWDVAVLGQTYANDGRYGATRILSPETVSRMTSEQVNFAGVRRGLGWMLQPQADSPVGLVFGPQSYGHTGFTGTSLWIAPRHELVVVLLTNRVYHGRDRKGIMDFRRRLHHAVLTAVET